MWKVFVTTADNIFWTVHSLVEVIFELVQVSIIPHYSANYKVWVCHRQTPIFQEKDLNSTVVVVFYTFLVLCIFLDSLPKRSSSSSYVNLNTTFLTNLVYEFKLKVAV